MKNQSSISIGFILILVGTFFLLLQFLPGFSRLFNMANLWPLIPLGIGVIFFFSGLVANPPLLVPGTILSGIGGILLLSNSFHIWDFWQLWLLVPAFVGLGIILMNLRSGSSINRAVTQGGPPLAVGIILFAVFTAVFSPLFGLFWPVILIGLGVFWLIRNMIFKR